MLRLNRLGVEHRALKTVWTVFLFALSVFFLYEIRSALVTFALALFLALMLSPVVALVDRFTTTRVPRNAALALVYIVMIGISVAVLVPIGSAIGEDARLLASKLPGAVQEDPFGKLPLPTWLEPLRERFGSVLKDRVDEIAKDALPLLAKAAGGLLTGLGTIVSAVLIPILAFFFIKDGRKIRDSILQSVGDEQRGRLADIFHDLRRLLAQYLRALVIIAVVTFVVFSGFLALTGAPYAVLLGGVAGLLEFIPAVGPFVAAISIIVVGLFSGYTKWALLVIFLIVYRIVLDYGLQPVLMSSGVKLHPLLVVFGALAGGEIAGIPGVFFSVPVMAALRVIVQRLVRD